MLDRAALSSEPGKGFPARHTGLEWRGCAACVKGMLDVLADKDFEEGVNVEVGLTNDRPF